MAIDLEYGCRILRVILVYLPYAGYPWNDFALEMEKINILGAEAMN